MNKEDFPEAHPHLPPALALSLTLTPTRSSNSNPSSNANRYPVQGFDTYVGVRGGTLSGPNPDLDPYPKPKRRAFLSLYDMTRAVQEPYTKKRCRCELWR